MKMQIFSPIKGIWVLRYPPDMWFEEGIDRWFASIGEVSGFDRAVEMFRREVQETCDGKERIDARNRPSLSD